jgi:type IV pilus assembly protein PilV
MRSITKQTGFTLLEVLIAVCILGIGLMAVSGLLGRAISGNAFSRDGTVAVELAQEMVDRIRANAGSTPNIYNGMNTSTGCVGADPALGDCTQWKTRLQGTTLINPRGTVTVTMDSPAFRSATVTVTVTWGPATTPQRTVTLTTILSTWLS